MSIWTNLLHPICQLLLLQVSVCVCARTLTLLTITSLSSVETFGHSPAC